MKVISILGIFVLFTFLILSYLSINDELSLSPSLKESRKIRAQEEPILMECQGMCGPCERCVDGNCEQRCDSNQVCCEGNCFDKQPGMVCCGSDYCFQQAEVSCSSHADCSGQNEYCNQNDGICRTHDPNYFCGHTITEDGSQISLSGDLRTQGTLEPCEDNGIVIIGNDISVDCNGYLIEGRDERTNNPLYHRSGGVISNPHAKDTSITYNGGGVSNCEIRGNSFSDGITWQNLNGVVENNKIYDTKHDGIFLIGQDSHFTEIIGNEIFRIGVSDMNGGILNDEASDIIFRNNNIYGFSHEDGYGIIMLGRNYKNFVFENNEIHDNYKGALLRGLQLSTLTGNTFHSNEYGLITTNKIAFNGYELVFRDNVFRNNQFNDNEYGFNPDISIERINENGENPTNEYCYEGFNGGLGGSGATGCYRNNIDESNTINGKPILYFHPEVRMPSGPITGDIGYLSCTGCNNVQIENTQFNQRNEDSIIITNSDNVLVSNSYIDSSNRGIVFADVTNGDVTCSNTNEVEVPLSFLDGSGNSDNGHICSCNNDGDCGIWENVDTCPEDCAIFLFSCLVDINDDNQISQADLDIINDNLGRDHCTYNEGEEFDWCSFSDINRDGFVDLEDVNIYNYNMGNSCDPLIGPEVCDGYDNNNNGLTDENDVCPVCGNYWCEIEENENNCPHDCIFDLGNCGNYNCEINLGENENNCPLDCSDMSCTIIIETEIGDGYIGATGYQSWDSIRNAQNGDAVSTQQSISIRAHKNNQGYGLFRGFLPFDTSIIPDGSNILDVRLIIDVSFIRTFGSVYDYVSVVEASQNSPITLEDNDFSLCGIIDNPEEGIDPIDRLYFPDTNLGQNLLRFNENGRNWVDDGSEDGYTLLGLRIGYDIENIPPLNTQWPMISIHSKESTNLDPKLEITYLKDGTEIETHCSNNIDEDCDGLFDELDPDCQ